MQQKPPLDQIAGELGISTGYASLMLAGKRRNVSADIALHALRRFGLRVGVLLELTSDDVDRLSQAVPPLSADNPCKNISEGGAQA